MFLALRPEQLLEFSSFCAVPIHTFPYPVLLVLLERLPALPVHGRAPESARGKGAYLVIHLKPEGIPHALPSAAIWDAPLYLVPDGLGGALPDAQQHVLRQVFKLGLNALP